MRQLVGLDPPADPNASPPSKFGTKAKKFAKGTGRVAETVVMHLPVLSMVYNELAPKAPPIQPGNTIARAYDEKKIMPRTARLLATIEGYTLPLTFDVPAPKPQEGIMNKTSGMAVRLDNWKTKQSESRNERRRQLLAIQQGHATQLVPRRSSSSNNILKKAWDWRMEQADRVAESNARLYAMTGKPDLALKTKVEIADRKEKRSIGNYLWVVVLTDEQGKTTSYSSSDE